MQSITPFLWFDGKAEEAAAFYASVFPNSSYFVSNRNPDGSALVASFSINGMNFAALNGGPHYQFSPATSFLIRCEDQVEVDHLWDSLVDGGSPMACGWLSDKFGVTWQIVPARFFELLDAGTPAQVQAVMGAMMQMVKFDVAALEAAFASAAG